MNCPELVADVLARLQAGQDVPRSAVTAAVKATLAQLSDIAPGRSVEIRIPPVAAIQAISGATHRRGTPPAVVECAPRTWLELACGHLTWDQAITGSQVLASGERSDLSDYLPLYTVR